MSCTNIEIDVPVKAVLQEIADGYAAVLCMCAAHKATRAQAGELKDRTEALGSADDRTEALGSADERKACVEVLFPLETR